MYSALVQVSQPLRGAAGGVSADARRTVSKGMRKPVLRTRPPWVPDIKFIFNFYFQFYGHDLPRYQIFLVLFSNFYGQDLEARVTSFVPLLIRTRPPWVPHAKGRSYF